ncbi:hypothetical protein [Prauserella alba]|uniref:FAD binding domain-containing protein n=1 Tax=Prauserella alba TaxID=176898 RepID=A0ABN1V6M7_9PSEU|nr:hypothetical protein [Prauserella alba]
MVRDLGFRTAAYVFSDPGTARTLGDVLHMLDAPGLQVGAYRVGADRVATATPLPADPRAELHRVYGGLGWTVPHLLDHCPEPANLYYDRVAQVQMSGWSRGRVVLVGDACQAPSLLTGQGAGMALSGAAALADRLHSDDVATALARYEDDLKPVVDRLQADGRAVAEECVPA